MTNKIRVRFAPAPTGMMHLGNIRTALMNYLFARQKGGTFILRVEDTDPERNYDPGAKKIMEDLAWLDITYQEGPVVGGPYAPYFQSERTDLYKKNLQKLIDSQNVYRCFCTQEELEKKRERQIAMKMPPRYDRTCLKLSEEEIQKNLANNKPFVWRVKLDHNKSVTITDMARGPITFEYKNFSDFPITRQNGTFTFMFTNFVDDMTMKITNVLRGEDHLTNSAGQAALYQAFDHPLPLFWHMPILCNIDGKKLSKRDFGFSLRDLKDAGYLPQAICDYLTIIGGSFAQEVMSLDELAKQFDFENIKATGQIKYDVEKLTWLNKQWIMKLDDEQLYDYCLPFLISAYPQAKDLDKQKLIRMLQIIKTDLATLKQSVDDLAFYFNEPSVARSNIEEYVAPENVDKIVTIIKDNAQLLNNPTEFGTAFKTTSKKQGIPLKESFSLVRLALTGQPRGLGLVQLVEILGPDEVLARINKI